VQDPIPELDKALSHVIGTFTKSNMPGGTDGTGTAIVAFRTNQDLQSLVSSLQRIIDVPGAAGGEDGGS
jgi:hypothetical protein